MIYGVSEKYNYSYRDLRDSIKNVLIHINIKFRIFIYISGLYILFIYMIFDSYFYLFIIILWCFICKCYFL